MGHGDTPHKGQECIRPTQGSLLGVFARWCSSLGDVRFSNVLVHPLCIDGFTISNGYHTNDLIDPYGKVSMLNTCALEERA
eukprot:scaffold45_cov337-Pavlova_lutheri.AAC.9